MHDSCFTGDRVVHSNPMADGTISVAIRAYTQARERDN
jgi:hypothetical protein